MPITLDNAPSARNLATTTASLSYSFTYGGGAGLIQVTAAYANDDGTNLTVAYNSETFTRVATKVFGTVYLGIFVLLNPVASGSHTITVTSPNTQGAILGTTISFLGNIFNGFANYQIAEEVAGTTLTNTIAYANGSVVTIGAASLAVDLTAGANVTSTTVANPLTGYYGPAVGAGSVGMVVNDASTDHIVSITVELISADTGSLFRPATLSGLQAGGPCFVNPLG